MRDQDNGRGSYWLIVNLGKTRIGNCLQAAFIFSKVPRQKAEITSNMLTYTCIPNLILAHLNAFGSIVFRGLSDSILK